MNKRSNLDRVQLLVPRHLRPRSGLSASMALVISMLAGAASAQTISVDASNSVSGNPRFWSTCVGTGTASLTLRADLQTHYKLAHRELGMERVRGHGILNDDMGIFQWAGNGAAPTYDWSKFDAYLAAIAAAGMRPIMELSFMPTDLARTGNDRDPPSNLDVYGGLIRAVVQHSVDLYGAEDVGQWYWEVWNEPNYAGFWTGTMQDYFALYDAAAAGATAVLPNILIGGPVTTAGSTTQMSDFLAHVKGSGARVTFLSSHAYPGGAGAAADASFGVNDNNGRLNVITGAGYGIADLPSFNTEWNSAYTGQGGNPAANNVSMDSHANAPFILKSVKLLADRVQGDRPPLDVFSYWAISDVFGESGGDARSYIGTTGGGTLPFGEVFGLLNYQGVRKAAYNAFRMLNYLGSERLQVSGGSGNADGVDAMASVSDDGNAVAVIVYNYYATISTTGSDSVTVNVQNLPFAGQPIFVTRFAIDQDHSNPYGAWLAQGRPNNPNEEQWRAMRDAQQLALLDPVATVTGESSYSTTINLPRQGAALIILSRTRPVTGRDAFVEIEAEDYDGQSAATREDSNDVSLGQSIAVGDGSSVYFNQVDFSDAGAESVQLRVNAQLDTSLELHADAETGPLLATCSVAATNGAWATEACPLTPIAGVHRVYAGFGGSLRLNWMKFGLSGAPDEGGQVGAGGAANSGTGGPATIGGLPVAGVDATDGVGVVPGAAGGGNVGDPTGSAGSAPVMGTPGDAPLAASDTAPASGCGCRIAGHRNLPSASIVGLGLAALGLLRRRRRASDGPHQRP
jgi:xylan 1,4-beta-xylosidase